MTGGLGPPGGTPGGHGRQLVRYPQGFLRGRGCGVGGAGGVAGDELVGARAQLTGGEGACTLAAPEGDGADGDGARLDGYRAGRRAADCGLDLDGQPLGLLMPGPDSGGG